MNPLTDQEIDELAHRRAAAQLGWYIHAAVYVVVNGALWLMAAQSTSGRHAWTVVPALGWGLGLAIHGIRVFARGAGLHERLAERERRRLLHARERAARG